MPPPPRPVARELRALLALAAPIVAAQVAMMMLGVMDTWMVGRLGTLELSAVALADIVLFGSLILGIGLVMGIDPIISQAHGAAEGAQAGRALQRGVVIALLASVPLMVVWHSTETILIALGQQPGLAAVAQTYADSQLFSVAPFLVFTAMRQYLLGRGITRPPLWILLAANVANVGFNEAFIFGRFGFPALGVAGAGLATGLTRLFMVIALFAIMRSRRLHEGAWTPWSAASFRPSGLLRVLAYGGPIGIQLCLEVWAFSGSTALAGHLPAPAVAAHIIGFRLAGLSFMLPLGLSIAAATRVGNLLGGGDPPGAQRAAWVAFGLSGVLMCGNAMIFVFARRPLCALFSDDATVVAAAAAVLPVAAAFQLFDGTQVIGSGILRGMGRPKPAAVFNLIGYYLLALPLGWLLAFRFEWGLAGIWWGLCAGLALVAALLVGWIAVRGPARVETLAIRLDGFKETGRPVD